jgi:hypothetical protein
LLGILDLNSVLSDWVADGRITYLIMGNPCIFWLIDVLLLRLVKMAIISYWWLEMLALIVGYYGL